MDSAVDQYLNQIFRRECCFAFVAVMALLAAGCKSSAGPNTDTVTVSEEVTSHQFRFEDVTAQSGLSFQNTSGAIPSYAPILQEMGGGCAVADWDRDGWLDVMVAGGGLLEERAPRPKPHGLFQNRDGMFRDVSLPSKVAVSRFYSHGVAAADYDADGFVDLLVTGFGGLQLFHNAGDGTFTELAQTDLVDSLWSTGAAWGDVNGDGNLDLYVCHYVDWMPGKTDPVCAGPTPHQPDSCPPRQFRGLPDYLFLSDGAGGFREISRPSGLLADGKGLGGVLVDLDGDRDVDIYVANDAVGNFLYRNDSVDESGMPHFSEIGAESGAAFSEKGTPDGSMGIAILDLDGNSFPDMWVSNYEYETPGVYRNESRLRFTHVARRCGLGAIPGSFVSFGTVARDFDGDGDSDVMVSNGHVLRYPQNGVPSQRCQLFENSGRGSFKDVAPSAGACLVSPHRGRGLAAGDLDQDGDPDLVLVCTDEPTRILRNSQQRTANWTRLEFVGKVSPRDGHGIVMLIEGEHGRRHEWLYGGESYLSSSSLQISLPDRPSDLEINVTWPSGRRQQLRRTSRVGNWEVDSGWCRLTQDRLQVIEPDS